MDNRFHAVLADYAARAAREADLMARTPPEDMMAKRDELLLSVGPETGHLLHTIASGAGAKTILELGTSYGYSTLFSADAARKTGGKVITLDVAPKKQEYAHVMLEKAGLADFVEFHAGDALEILPRLSGPFDFILLDIWKDLYAPCLELFFPKLAPGGFIAADNMIEPAFWRADALAYRRAVRAKPGISSVLLPVGSGIELSRLTGAKDDGL